MIRCTLFGHRAVRDPRTIHQLTCRWCAVILLRVDGYWIEAAHIGEWAAPVPEDGTGGAE